MEIELTKGDVDAAKIAMDELKEYTKNHEKELRRVFDTYIFNSKLNRNVEKLINNMH